MSINNKQKYTETVTIQAKQVNTQKSNKILTELCKVFTELTFDVEI